MFFEHIHQERIWGGDTLQRKFGRDLHGRKIGESWEIACHDNGTGIISNGPLKGMDLISALEQNPIEILGEGIYNSEYAKFPLLIKVLDAADVLSVQVHPDDEYAARNENGELGKTEMWYIMDALPGSKLVYGVKPGTTPGRFRDAASAGQLEECLQEVPVKKGDVFFIPAGMVHAIGAGILICEIQQNSDTTYRVYDWNRVDDKGRPRALHINKALDVIDFEGRYNEKALPGLTIEETGGRRTYYAACRYFAMEKLDVYGAMEDGTDGKRFCTLTCIEGSGRIHYEGGSETMTAVSSCLIPAALKDYKLEGNMTVIKAYVPDRENNIIKPLLKRGFSREQLSVIAGLFDE